MDLIEVLDQVRALLRSKGRLTYRLLAVPADIDRPPRGSRRVD